MIQPRPMTPTAASTTDSAAAFPAPFPEADDSPTTKGTKNAMENTGPMNPTDCATASTSVSFFAPPNDDFNELSDIGSPHRNSLPIGNCATVREQTILVKHRS